MRLPVQASHWLPNIMLPVPQALEFLKAVGERPRKSPLSANDLASSLCSKLTGYQVYLLYCGAIKAMGNQGSAFFSQSDLKALRQNVDTAAESEGLFIVHKQRDMQFDIAALCSSVRTV